MERTINASEFKAKCLAILDEVERTGVPVTILKRGRPVAQLRPATSESSSHTRLMGTVTYLGDIVAPAMNPDVWDADSGNL